MIDDEKRLYFTEMIEGEELFNCNICKDFHSAMNGFIWGLNHIFDGVFYWIFICNGCFDLNKEKK